MIKTNQLLLLESLNWKGGDLIPNYGYYYGLINNKLIFFCDPEYPFDDKEFLDENEVKEDDKYIIEGIRYVIPTLNEVIDILSHIDGSHLAKAGMPTGLPTRILVSDYWGYCFNTIKNKPQLYDSKIHPVAVLLVNSIDLNNS